MRANSMAWTVGLALLASGSPAVAAADDPSPDAALVWRCWWDQAVHVSCALERLPAVPSLEAAPAARLPAIVATLRARPQAFRDRFVHIPLHTHPFHMDGVRALAQAVMCGARQDCQVRFSAGLPHTAELDLLADPVLAGGG